MTNPQFDHVHMIKVSDHGVWLSIRGSTLIHLYDRISFKCKLVFNMKSNQILSILNGINLNDNTVTSLSTSSNSFKYELGRVTSLVAFKNLVWLGTGDGYLYIYKIKQELNPNLYSTMNNNNNVSTRNNSVNLIRSPLIDDLKKSALKKSASVYMPNVKLDQK
jgi:hypothetical protein